MYLMTNEPFISVQQQEVLVVTNMDKSAFKRVFDLYFNALCSFGSHYVQDTFIVEDLVQETFIGLWNKKNDFEHINALKAFLYTTVRNKCLNHLKHQLVLKKHDKDLILELESNQTSSEQIIVEETFNQLFQEIKNLPKASQEVMLLALNGLKNQEIADELGITINTVKTQKKIAYSKLKNRIHPVLNLVLLCL
jgi:RNA polymerase sigma-70 factor (ECF subfamily)